MSNDAILASISKIHAYRYAKEKQRGVKLGENQAPSMATKFTTAPLQIGTGDFSVEFYGNSYGSDANLGYPFISYDDGIASNRKFSALARPGTNGVALLPFGESTFRPSYVVEDDDALFHMVVTRSGTDVALYIDGSKVNDFATDSIVDFGTMDFLVANSRNVGFVRVWNYALSADEIATLYNNGDPMGYVVPKASRYFEKSYQSNFTDGTDGWTGYRSSPGLLIESKEGILEISGDYANYQIRMPYPPAPKCASRYKMRVEFAEPVSISRYALYAFTGNSTFQENVTEPKTILDGVTPLDNNLSQYCYIYLYGITPNTVVKIKSISVEPVGCIAEYVAPNLIATKKGPQIEPNADTFEFNIGSPYSIIAINSQKYPYDCFYRIDYVVEEWNYQPNVINLVGFLGINGAEIVSGNKSWFTLKQAKIGELQSVFVKMPGIGSPRFDIYGGSDNEEITARHLKVTIKSITPISIASTWLDSAKQLPWSDAYLPPLLQSKGGYDMVANGAPEVLFNE